MLEDVVVIMTKKANKLTVMPEDYKLLGNFADVAERRLLSARLEARQARLAEINAVKSTLPQEAFKVPVQKLDLPDEIIESLQPLENVGEIMLRFLIDENRLRRLLGGNSEKALLKVQDALDKLFSAPGEMVELAAEADEAEAVQEQAPVEAEIAETVEEQVEVVEAEQEEEAEEALPEVFAEEEEEETPAVAAKPEVLPVAFPDEIAGLEETAEQKERRRKFKAVVEPDEDFDEDFDELSSSADDKRKKDRAKRRQLVFDEELGKTVAKRRRKGGRKRDSWSDEF